MKAKILFLLLILIGNCLLLSGQNGSWFKKGLDEKKPEKQVEYFTKSIETEGATAETYLHRGDAYMNLALDAAYNRRGIVFVIGRSDTHNAQIMYEKARNDTPKQLSLTPDVIMRTSIAVIFIGSLGRSMWH